MHPRFQGDALISGDKMYWKALSGTADYFYFVFRVFIGLLFFQHGAQKLFGWFGGEAAELFSLMGVAGLIEFFGGLLIAIGLLTQIVALVGIIEMAVAYLMVHFPQGIVPIMNGGELALLYFAAFLVIFVYGARKFGVDNLIFKKRGQKRGQ